MKAEEIRAKIEAAKSNWPQKTVPVPAWGIEVLVRGFDGNGRSEYHKFIAASDENAGLHQHKLLSLTVCDEDGQLIYPDNDGKEFGNLPSCDQNELIDVATTLCFMSRKATEELEKNLQSEGTTGSG